MDDLQTLLTAAIVISSVQDRPEPTITHTHLSAGPNKHTSSSMRSIGNLDLIMHYCARVVRNPPSIHIAACVNAFSCKYSDILFNKN